MTIKNRGFASLDPEKRREVAASGGKAAHARGVAHEWTSESARAAGKIGGLNSAKARWGRKAVAEAV